MPVGSGSAVYSAASHRRLTHATTAANSPSFSCDAGILSVPFTWVTRRATPAMNFSLVANRICACQLPSTWAPRVEELPGAPREVAVDEHALPRHQDVLEHHQRVRLVVARGQRVVVLAGRRRLYGRRQYSFRPWRCRQREADGEVLVVRAERLDAGDEHLVGDGAAGGEHLGAADDDALLGLATTPTCRKSPSQPDAVVAGRSAAG